MTKPKIILGIESSCDETAAAVCLKDANGVQILSNIVASSASLQAKYGGVIPEQAAREQLKSIIPVIQEALSQAFPDQIPNTKYQIPLIDAIAVTEGPGLIGSLLVGVETAKTLAKIWDKPLIPVNHLLGHFYANWITDMGNVSSIMYYGKEKKSKSFRRSRKLRLIHNTYPIPQFPCLGLLVSGGHTDLVLFTDHGKYEYLGGTRDDAAGECFDKCARLLGLSYPGGPAIAKTSEKGNSKKFKLPRPMIDSGDFDFSFSGLKTAVNILVKDLGDKIKDKQTLADLCASTQEAIIEVLVKKTIAAAQEYNVDQIIVAGGVAANKILSYKLHQKLSEIIPHAKIFIPPSSLCTDNAASIATAAFFNYDPIDPLESQANPNLSFL